MEDDEQETLPFFNSVGLPNTSQDTGTEGNRSSSLSLTVHQPILAVCLVYDHVIRLQERAPVFADKETADIPVTRDNNMPSQDVEETSPPVFA